MADILTQGTQSYAGIPELKSFSSKKPLYRHPGAMKDSLYYDSDSSSVYPIEAEGEVGKYFLTIPGATYNSRFEVTIPNLNFCDRATLQIVMERPTVSVTGASLCRGWGYRLLDQIVLMYPSANMSSLTFDNITQWHGRCAMAQTQEQLTYYDRKGGECLVNGDFALDINLVPQDSTAGVGKLVANLIVELPWSSIASGIFAKKGIDTTLMNNPIRLAFVFSPASAIWGSYATPPSFSATFSYKDTQLTNKSLSLRNTLFSEPGKRITYPSCWRQPQSIFFNANKTTNTSYNLPLSSFIASDLLGLSISIHLASEVNPTTANTPAMPFNPVEIVNPMLTFGGETLFNCFNDLWKIHNATSTISGVEIETPINVFTGGAMVTNGSKIASVLFIDFTKIRQICSSEDFYNAIKYDSQQLNFQFNLAPSYWYVDNAGAPASVAIRNQDCVLYCVAYYPMVTSIESGGSVEISFN